MAFSVASGTAALGHYAVAQAGPVLVYAAEDPPATVKNRLEGFAELRGLDLRQVPLHLILCASLRLDTPRDQARLAEAVARYRPRLLVLVPFVRLHRIDENSALEVSGILAYLRELQREHRLAVLVVHHARKHGTPGGQAGQGLRGSGDFHAWGDSNLYLRRHRGSLELVIEHRSAPSPDPRALELHHGNGTPPHLVVTGPPSADEAALEDLKTRVLDVLAEDAAPLTQEALRERLKVRMQRLVATLRELDQDGANRREPAGWVLGPDAQHDPAPCPGAPLPFPG